MKQPDYGNMVVSVPGIWTYEEHSKYPKAQAHWDCVLVDALAWQSSTSIPTYVVVILRAY